MPWIQLFGLCLDHRGCVPRIPGMAVVSEEGGCREMDLRQLQLLCVLFTVCWDRMARQRQAE